MNYNLVKMLKKFVVWFRLYSLKHKIATLNPESLKMEEPDAAVPVSSSSTSSSTSSNTTKTGETQDVRYKVSLVMNFNQDNEAVSDGNADSKQNFETVKIDVNKNIDKSSTDEKIEEEKMESGSKHEVPLSLRRQNSASKSPDKKINKLISFFNLDAQLETETSTDGTLQQNNKSLATTADAATSEPEKVPLQSTDQTDIAEKLAKTEAKIERSEVTTDLIVKAKEPQNNESQFIHFVPKTEPKMEENANDPTAVTNETIIKPLDLIGNVNANKNFDEIDADGEETTKISTQPEAIIEVLEDNKTASKDDMQEDANINAVVAKTSIELEQLNQVEQMKEIDLQKENKEVELVENAKEVDISESNIELELTEQAVDTDLIEQSNGTALPEQSNEVEQVEQLPKLPASTVPVLTVPIPTEPQPASTVPVLTVPLPTESEPASTDSADSTKLVEQNEQTNSCKKEISDDIRKDSIISKSSDDSISVQSVKSVNKTTTSSSLYPVDLNPFGSDDDEEVEIDLKAKSQKTLKENLNPFDSSDDEIELEKSPRSSNASTTPSSSGKVPPPRPPPPRILMTPHSQEDRDAAILRRTSLTSSFGTKTPVPTPRSNVTSLNTTPEATPRLSNRSSPAAQIGDFYGSANSLNNSTTSMMLMRNSELRGSSYSLASNNSRSYKNRKAPAPPPPPAALSKELFPSNESVNGCASKTSTPTSSSLSSPKQLRKKRQAPAPPKPTRLGCNDDNTGQPKNSLSYPLQGGFESQLSDDEKVLLEGKHMQQQQLHISNTKNNQTTVDSDDELATFSRRNSRRLIPLDKRILADSGANNTMQTQPAVEETAEPQVVYRRLIAPLKIDSPTHDGNPLMEKLRLQHDRQLEKLKDNKEAQNRNRQILNTNNADDSNFNALQENKKQKRPAPNLPIPPRKVLQILPLQEIKHELEIIETQQLGLEKQGIVLEKMIRDRCEGENGELLHSKLQMESVADGNYVTSIEDVQNSKEVEDLILQLFELVNEKNELFRRQAELMYLRRQHRLEQEHADLEHEIRVLMARPERNKTDTDKAREKQLIERLVEVVQMRNDVIDSLEMDRLREVEEDMSIKEHMEQHTSLRSDKGDSAKKSNSKLSKKEKKLSRSKKGDVDKDADETSVSVAVGEKQKSKKKKIKRLFFK